MPKKTNGVKVLKIRKNATLREIYRAAKEQFTAADLARFCQDEPMISAEQFLAEMEAIYEKEMRHYKNNKGKKKTKQHGLIHQQTSLDHPKEGGIGPKRHNGVRVLNVRKNASLKEIYREAKKQFTAEDLARYCQNERMVPGEQVLAELEAVYKKEMGRYKGSQNKKKKK
jgi:hypothetical protein